VALYCEDTDAVVVRAEKAGATIREPAQTFVPETASRRSWTRSDSAGR
jgi:hypothetical protein